MSYVNKKTRAFRTIKDVRLEPRRSQGRMKTYPSAIDMRAWCGIREDRRQHILEIVKYGYGDKFQLLPYDLLIKYMLEHQAMEAGKIKNATDADGAAKRKAWLDSICKNLGPAGEGSAENMAAVLTDSTEIDDSGSSTVASGLVPKQKKFMKDFCICVKMQKPKTESHPGTSQTDSSLFLEACDDNCPVNKSDSDQTQHKCKVADEIKSCGETLCPLKKIQELENKLVLKRKHTKQKVDLLKSTLDKFKRELELERQRNNNLIRRYCNQTKTVESMQAEIRNVKKESSHDKKKLGQINSTLKKIMAENSAICRESERDFSGDLCKETCKQVKKKTPPKKRLPHFHAEISFMNIEHRYRHKCTVKKNKHPPCVIKLKSSGCSLGIEE